MANSKLTPIEKAELKATQVRIENRKEKISKKREALRPSIPISNRLDSDIIPTSQVDNTGLRITEPVEDIHLKVMYTNVRGICGERKRKQLTELI